MKCFGKIYLIVFFIACSVLPLNAFCDTIPTTNGALEDTVKVLNKRFWTEYRKGLSEGLRIAQKSNSYTDKIKDLKLKSVAYYNLSVVYKSLDRYDSSFYYAQKAIEIDSIRGDNRDLAINYSHLGNIFSAVDDYSKALEFYFKSLKIKESLSDSLGLAIDYHNIGHIYSETKDYNKALVYYKKGLNIFIDQDFTVYIATAYNNLGVTYFYKKDIDQAEKYYAKALEIYKRINDKVGEALGYSNFGTIAQERKKYNLALHYYLKGYRLRIQNNDPSGITNSLINLGSIYLAKDEYDKAEESLLDALNRADEIKSISLKENVLHQLILLYEELKDYESAFMYQKSYQAVLDSIYDENKAKRFIQLSLEFEFEKQQKAREYELNAERQVIIGDLERVKFVRRLLLILLIASFLIILLYFRFNQAIRKTNKSLKAKTDKIIQQKHHLENINREVIKAKEELGTINSEKDRFFSIIAHDLKNPFNIMIGITSILSSGEVNIDRKEELQFLKDLHQVATDGYKLLQNLLEWARIQKGESRFIPEHLDIRMMIDETTTLLKHMAVKKDINLVIDVPNGTHAYGDKNMLTTVIRNLLSNALKFTNKKGEVVVGSEIKNNFLKIYVKDNGVGISEENMDKLFRIDQSISTYGTDNESGTGLGLILCKGFVETNGGKIWVESEVNVGTTFIFTVPLRPDIKINSEG